MDNSLNQRLTKTIQSTISSLRRVTLKRTLSNILLLFSLLSPDLNAQTKGDFFIGYGFEFPSGGYLSLRYYPVDKIGIEVYSSAFWYIFNFGARANIHVEQSLPHTFISIGYSHITAYNPGAVHDTSNAELLFLKRTMQGVDLGVGREVEYDYKHFSFQAGPTYVLKLEDSFVDNNRKIQTIETAASFSYFLVATQMNQLPEKNPKPIYVK